MKLQIFAKDIELTDSLQEMIDKKFVAKLQKFFNGKEENTRLTLRHGARWGFRVKFEAGKIFAEHKHKELRSALVGLADEVSSILVKEKEKNLQK